MVLEPYQTDLLRNGPIVHMPISQWRSLQLPFQTGDGFEVAPNERGDAGLPNFAPPGNDFAPPPERNSSNFAPPPDANRWATNDLQQPGGAKLPE
jgi:hypothetical protein